MMSNIYWIVNEKKKKNEILLIMTCYKNVSEILCDEYMIMTSD